MSVGLGKSAFNSTSDYTRAVMCWNNDADQPRGRRVLELDWSPSPYPGRKAPPAANRASVSEAESSRTTRRLCLLACASIRRARTWG